MRAIGLTSLSCLAFITAFASIARAEPTTVLTRGGSTAPWLHLTPAAARSGTSLGLADAEPAARVALGRVLSAASRSLTTQVTRTDRFGDGEAIVHFEQTHDGLPVIGRGAAVRLSASGDAILTGVDLEEQLPASTIPGVPASVAVTIASKVKVGSVSERDVHLVVWPMPAGGSRLAWVALPVIPTGLPTAPRIVIDAQTGKVIEVRDLVSFLAQASVYRFNPLTTPALSTVDLPMAPSTDGAVNGKLTNDFVYSRNCIDNKTVAAVTLNGFNLKLHVCDLMQVATADANGDFLYTPNDDPTSPASKSDAFSEVAMYYHATKAYEFFRGLAGTPDAQIVVDKPLPVVANLQTPDGIFQGNLTKAADPNVPLVPFQNAFFSPSGGGLGMIFAQIYNINSGALWFGQGPRHDYAYDGDVVYHEFTHAVVDRTLKLGSWHLDAYGIVDAPGAMNEGLADFFSSAITGDPNVGEYASKDIDPSLTVIRTLANKDRCPTNIIGEVHYDSTLFSGGLWEARASLPEADRSKFDTALYKAMASNPGRGDLGYDDLAKLFMATLATDLPSGKTALETAMTTRGVLPACNRVIEYGATAVTAPAKDLGGFSAPGTQTVPVGTITPGILQVHVKLPVGTPMVAVAFTVPPSMTGSNPLGGSATPFKPVVLAKFGKAITWTAAASTASSDADAMVAATGTGAMTASITPPAGATDLYVQIGNEGESDGVYDALTLTLTPAPVVTPPADTPPTTTTTSSTDSGCGCSTPGSSGDGSRRMGGIGLLAALSLVAGVVRRRRTESSRRRE